MHIKLKNFSNTPIRKCTKDENRTVRFKQHNQRSVIYFVCYWLCECINFIEKKNNTYKLQCEWSFKNAHSAAYNVLETIFISHSHAFAEKRTLNWNWSTKEKQRKPHSKWKKMIEDNEPRDNTPTDQTRSARRRISTRKKRPIMMININIRRDDVACPIAYKMRDCSCAF